MVAGITIFSNDNTIQVDDRYDTYGLTNKYITTSIIGTQGQLTALAPSVNGGIIELGKDPHPTSVDVFEFKKTNATPNDNFGLEVFDANGSTMFHSSKKPLRILDFVRMPPKKPLDWQNIPTLSKSYPNAAKVGVVISNWSPMVAETGKLNLPSAIFRPTIKITGNVVVFGWWGIEVGVVIPSTLGNFCDYLVVDLTNY